MRDPLPLRRRPLLSAVARALVFKVTIVMLAVLVAWPVGQGLQVVEGHYVGENRMLQWAPVPWDLGDFPFGQHFDGWEPMRQGHRLSGIMVDLDTFDSR